jgi:Tol biopolymer transport system component
VLYQIPALGGTSHRLLTGIDSAVTMSPDGRQFAYYRADHPERGTSQLIVANADGSNPRAIATLRPPRFFAPGFFVAPAWSPDGARLAAGVRNSETRDAALSTFDVASGTEHVFPTRYLGAAFTAWLPDGSAILFTAAARGTIGFGLGGQIWLQPFPEGEPRRITSDLLEYRTLSVSADGASLVTVATETSSSLWMHPLDRHEPDHRIPSQRYEGMVGLSWMPDGRLLFSSLEGVNWQLWVMNGDGSNRRQLTTEGSNAWPCATPDGRAIVFYSTHHDQLGVWRMDADGSNPRLLTPAVDASHVAVTPDGRWVVFASQREGSTSAWRLPIDGGTPTLIAPYLERVSVSPDGRAVAGIYRESSGAQLELAVVPLEGGAPTYRVGGPFASTGDVRWTTDGRGLMVVTSERTNVWRYPLSGGEPERVTDFAEGNTFRLEPSPDGRTLAIVRGQLARDAFRLKNFQ